MSNVYSGFHGVSRLFDSTAKYLVWACESRQRNLKQMNFKTFQTLLTMKRSPAGDLAYKSHRNDVAK